MTTSHVAWLASYPKSGNTWVRALLEALENGGAIDINNLSQGQAVNDSASFALCPLADLSPVETLHMFRGIRAAMVPMPGRSYVRIKTHHAWLPADDGLPWCWQPDGARAVYLVRDPRAVAVSYAHHMSMTREQIVSLMALESYSSGEMNLSYPHTIFSSWSTNVRTWTRQCDIPVLVVRYEDLSADTAQWLCRIADWLQVPYDDELIERSVAACTLQALATSELVYGFKESVAEDRAFFRRGETESWRFELEPILSERIQLRHAEMMQEFGYA